jgi:hypothetical protein
VLLARMGSWARDGGIRAADAGIVELFGGLSARQFAELVGQLQRREPTRRSGTPLESRDCKAASRRPGRPQPR